MHGGSMGPAGLGGMGALGFDLNVHLPPSVTNIANELPNTSEALKSIGASLDAGNITSQSVAVLAVFGVIITALILREK